MTEEKIKILLVEDEAMTAFLLRRNLQLLGYQVAKPLATGEAAIEAVQEQDYDVVLMDIRLAGKMDGIQAAEQISALNCTKIVFLTGYLDDEIMQRAQVCHPAAYLVKPVTPDDIQPVIAELFPTNSPPD
jgi:CheY-like chemotaxis protein